MNQYKNAHWWMLLAFVVMQIGFLKNYWLKEWTEEPWIDHVHGFSAMGWYLLVIAQPYLATRNKMKSHRLWGMIGLILAGGTAFSALAVLPRNVRTGDSIVEAGKGDPTFIYGVITSDFIMILAFIVAVVTAVVKRKNLHDHAIWMMSTVLFILSAGLGRAISNIGKVRIIDAQNISGIIIILIFLIMGYRLKKLTHPAIICGILVNMAVFPISWLGKQPWYIEFVQSVMKY